MTTILKIDTADRGQVRAFLELPFRLYRDTPQWVPPLAGDSARMLDRKKHPYYRHSDAAFFLARQGNNVVGRIAALDNAHYNDYNHERTAFFFLFECVDDPAAARALFDAAFAWARARGLSKIIGPKGFTALDGLGLLIKGAEHRPAFGIPYNPAYYDTLVAAAGFETDGDIVSGYLDPRALNAPRFEQISRLAERVKQRRGLRIARYTRRSELRQHAVPALLRLYNEALSETTGNTPLNADEVRTMADQIAWFADPKLIKIVMKDDDPVGFLLAYPDVSAACQRTRGRLFPLGWADFLLEFKRTRWVNINGAGISEKYRGMGGTAILFDEMRKSVIEGGFAHADCVQVGVENSRMQRELRDLGIDFYKTHRMYPRAL